MTNAFRSWRLPTEAQIEQAEVEFAEEFRRQLEGEPPDPEPEAEL
jgi:hypothetical protein